MQSIEYTKDASRPDAPAVQDMNDGNFDTLQRWVGAEVDNFDPDKIISFVRRGEYRAERDDFHFQKTIVRGIPHGSFV